MHDRLRRAVQKLAHSLKARPYLWIFFLGLTVRLLYLYQARLHNPLLDYPQMDANEYVTWARRILAGHLLYDRVTYTPIYPYYLALFLGVLKSPFLIFGLFHVIGAFQAVMIGKVAEMVASRRIGVVAGVLAATYWPFILYEATFHAENLTLISIVLALYFFLRSREGRLRDPFLAGLFFAVAAMTRPNLYLLAPAVLLASAWVTVRSRLLRPAARNAKAVASLSPRPVAVFLLPIVALTLPVLIRNQQLTGAMMLRDQGSLSVFLGNNPDFEGLCPRSGLDFRNLLFEPTAEGYTSQKAQQAYWWDRTRRVLRERPRDWLVLQAKKLLMNLNAFEVSQEFDIGYYRSRSSVLSLPWPGAGWVIPLGILGLLLTGFRSGPMRILSSYVLLYFLSVFPVQVAARYRLPMFPVLIIFAAYALVLYADLIRDRQWRRIRRLLALTLVLGFVSVPDHLDLRRKNRIFTTYQIADKAFNQLHNPALAMTYYRKSVQAHPDDYNSYFWMAYIHLHEGKIAEGRGYLRHVLQNKPNSPDAWWLLAESYVLERDLTKAEESLNKALQLAPLHGRALELRRRLNALKRPSDGR